MLMPGMIDMHGDMIEREVEPRPNVPMPMEMGLRTSIGAWPAPGSPPPMRRYRSVRPQPMGICAPMSIPAT